MKFLVTRVLGAYQIQCFQTLCTPSGRQSVLCKWKLRCLSSFAFFFSNFQFFLLSLLYRTYGQFSSKLSQQLLDLELLNFAFLWKLYSLWWLPPGVCSFVLTFCCFMSQVNSHGHSGTVSSPNHTFYLGKLEQAVNRYFLHILSLFLLEWFSGREEKTVGIVS